MLDPGLGPEPPVPRPTRTELSSAGFHILFPGKACSKTRMHTNSSKASFSDNTYPFTTVLVKEFGLMWPHVAMYWQLKDKALGVLGLGKLLRGRAQIYLA